MTRPWRSCAWSECVHVENRVRLFARIVREPEAAQIPVCRQAGSDLASLNAISTGKSACIRASMDRARVAIRSVTRRSRNRCPARRQPGARPQNLRPLEQLRRCAFRSGCVLRRGSSFYATPSLMGMTLASVARSAKFRMSASSASWIGLGRTKQFSLSKSAASSAS